MRGTQSSSIIHTSARAARLVALALAVVGAAGCAVNPSPGNAAYKEGELGNGDFLFGCDDGAACLPYSGDATLFPEQIATGATFSIRFVANGQQGTAIVINDKQYEGVTTQPVAPYLSEGPDGFTAVKPGLGTVVVRDNRGTIIDFVTLKIVQPDGLVVYDASYASKSKDPPRLQTLNMQVGDAPSYRVVTEYQHEAIAGSVPVEWTSKDPDVVEVESYSRRVVTLRAKGPGKTTITAVGAALTKDLDVEVSP